MVDPGKKQMKWHGNPAMVKVSGVESFVSKLSLSLLGHYLKLCVWNRKEKEHLCVVLTSPKITRTGRGGCDTRSVQPQWDLRFTIESDC